MPSPSLSYKISFGYIKIYWSNILFLRLLADGLQIQAHENNGVYRIQFYSGGAIITTELDSFDKWKAVLTLLDKAVEQISPIAD